MTACNVVAQFRDASLALDEPTHGRFGWFSPAAPFRHPANASSPSGSSTVPRLRADHENPFAVDSRGEDAAADVELIRLFQSERSYKVAAAAEMRGGGGGV